LPGAVVAEVRLELAQPRPRGLLVARSQRGVEAIEVLAQPLHLGRREASTQVARRRAVHAGDLHVAAERDRADAVLHAAPPRLGERRAEAEVELPRAHPDRARDDEVPALVHEDQERQTQDRDEDAHATGTSSLARRSASRSSSRSRAAAPSTWPRTSSTRAAMSRKPMR